MTIMETLDLHVYVIIWKTWGLTASLVCMQTYQINDFTDVFLKHWTTYLSPLLRAMPMSFSMPPASRRALAFSMFLVMTSCRAQQMAVTVSSDMALLGGPVVPEVPLLVALLLLLLQLPGNRWIKSLIAYLPGVWGKRGKGWSTKHWSNFILCTCSCSCYFTESKKLPLKWFSLTVEGT